MKKITATKGICLFHIWDTKFKSYDGHVYQECSSCGSRRVYIPKYYGNHVIRYKWIAGETDRINQSPKWIKERIK